MAGSDILTSNGSIVVIRRAYRQTKDGVFLFLHQMFIFHQNYNQVRKDKRKDSARKTNKFRILNHKNIPADQRRNFTVDTWELFIWYNGRLFSTMTTVFSSKSKKKDKKPCRKAETCFRTDLEHLYPRSIVENNQYQVKHIYAQLAIIESEKRLT